MTNSVPIVPTNDDDYDDSMDRDYYGRARKYRPPYSNSRNSTPGSGTKWIETLAWEPRTTKMIDLAPGSLMYIAPLEHSTRYVLKLAEEWASNSQVTQHAEYYLRKDQDVIFRLTLHKARTFRARPVAETTEYGHRGGAAGAKPARLNLPDSVLHVVSIWDVEQQKWLLSGFFLCTEGVAVKNGAWENTPIAADAHYAASHQHSISVEQKVPVAPLPDIVVTNATMVEPYNFISESPRSESQPQGLGFQPIQTALASPPIMREPAVQTPLVSPPMSQTTSVQTGMTPPFNPTPSFTPASQVSEMAPAALDDFNSFPRTVPESEGDDEFSENSQETVNDEDEDESNHSEVPAGVYTERAVSPRRIVELEQQGYDDEPSTFVSPNNYHMDPAQPQPRHAQIVPATPIDETITPDTFKEEADHSAPSSPEILHEAWKSVRAEPPLQDLSRSPSPVWPGAFPPSRGPTPAPVVKSGTKTQRGPLPIRTPSAGATKNPYFNGRSPLASRNVEVQASPIVSKPQPASREETEIIPPSPSPTKPSPSRISGSPAAKFDSAAPLTNSKAIDEHLKSSVASLFLLAKAHGMNLSEFMAMTLDVATEKNIES